MKRYEKYKPSGVEWIGEIPEHWNVKKLSHSFRTIGSGTTPEAGNPKYYFEGSINWVNTGDLNDSVLNESSRQITELAFSKFSTLKMYPKGTILIAMYGATIGKLSILNIEACTNQACCALAKSEIFIHQYIFYWLLSNRQNIINLSYGGGQPNISQEIIRQLRVSCPPLAEQQAIVGYLDEKCGAIDALIERKEQLLELYAEKRQAIINRAVTRGINLEAPLKDSGIPYFRQIPAHWEVKKLKNIVSKIGSGVTPTGGSEVYQTEGIPLLRSQNIYSGGLRLDDVAYISIEIDESMSNSRVQNGDVLLNITGGSIGRCYYIPQGFGSANVNQHVCIIRPKFNLVDTKYLNMLIGSNIGQEQIELQQTGANREGLNFEQLKGFNILLPELKEQTAIVSHIEEKCGKIDQICEKLRHQIDLYREYRTALIANAVTGKIKI